MLNNKNLCPVPFDQQPLNEYEALKNSILFSWSIENLPKFSQKLAIIFIIISSISIALNILAFTIAKLSISTIFNSFILALFIIEILLIRLYLGWSYIFKRLSSATIFYEESGWYDGQLWIKSADLLTQDRLVSMYQLEPLLLRIKKIFTINSIFVFLVFMFKEIL